MATLNALMLASLIGPAGKGAYQLLVLPPNMVVVLVQFGLPAAVGYYAARGQTDGLFVKAVVGAMVPSLVALAVMVALMPTLQSTLLRGLGSTEILVGYVAMPMIVLITCLQPILIARRAVRWHAAVMLVLPINTAILLIILVGICKLGVTGAIVAFLCTVSVQLIGTWLGAARACASVPAPSPVSYRALFRFGLPSYPGAVATFFSFRIDVLILAALLADAAAPLGYYTLAVTFAEMVFFLSNAVSMMFFPHVAGAPREQSDRLAPFVSRVTLSMAFLGALALVPIATALVSVVLPAFMPSLGALYVLLPGVVVLSVAKVLAGYASGLGFNAYVSTLNAGAFAANVAANLVLIPPFGIYGAAAASLISYGAAAIAFTVLGSRLAHASPVDFWLPRRADLQYVKATVTAVVRRYRSSNDRAT